MKQKTENPRLKSKSPEFELDIEEFIFWIRSCNEENDIEKLKHGLLEEAMNEFIWSETFLELTKEKREDFHGQFIRLRFLLDLVHEFASAHPLGKKGDYIEIPNVFKLSLVK